MMRNYFFSKFVFYFAAFILPCNYVTAQWSTQTIDLKPGWNGVFLHVDASHSDIVDLEGLDSNITDIWLWRPKLKSDQFIQDPDVPTDTKSRWVRWNKGLGPSSSLQRLVGNSAYLVRYGEKNEDGTWSPNTGIKWNIKGIPVPPSYKWTSTGLNFFGLPNHPNNLVSFERFFPPDILNGEPSAQFYTYRGGELSDIAGSRNPDEVVAKRSTAMRRGEAFWMRIGDSFNTYFGPFDLVLQNSQGAHFGESRERYRIVVRNRVEEAITVTMSLRDSESAPTGQSSLKNGLKILVRGTPSLTDLSYGYSKLEVGSPALFTLSPRKSGTVGSNTSEEIIIGIDRHALEGNPGDKFGGILEFKDSLGMLLYEVPITATIPSNSGLWVGTAKVGEVRHDITFFRKTDDGGVIINENGEAEYDGINQTYGGVGEVYPLRMIFHRNVSDEPKMKLFQRLFYGLRKDAEVATDLIITNDERALDKKFLGSAIRIASSHLPWSKSNNGWLCSGEFKLGKEMIVNIVTKYNDRVSNPFIHAYHPDHDNLDAKFENELVQGYESWGINREMKFRFDAPKNDFDSLVSVGRKYQGEYHEMVELTGIGVEKKSYYVKGVFTLNRLNESNELIAYDDSDIDPREEVPTRPDEEIVDNDGDPVGEDDNIDGSEGNPNP